MSNLLKNFKLSFFSQAIAILIGVMRATIIPLYLGLADFGYWQVYVLYLGLIGILSLGYLDGIYLNCGGLSESDINFNEFRSAGVIYLFVSVFFILLLYLIIDHTVLDESKRITLLYLLPNVILVGLTSYYLIVFQITNQIYKYSRYLIIDKILFILSLPLLIVTEQLSFQSLIILDIISRCVLLLLLVLKYNYYIFGNIDDLKIGLIFFVKNIGDGSKLLLANMAGMILLVLGRLYVENNFSIAEFSVYAFGISVTNILLMAVGSVSVVLYPVLKNMSHSECLRFFSKSNNLINAFFVLALLLYFPACFIVANYMLEYVGVLPYLSLLFVICLLQCKMQVLLNTYYKVLRKERRMLIDNISTIIIACMLLYFVDIYYNTIYAVVFSLTIAMLGRTVFSEIHLRKCLKLNLRPVIFNVLLAVAFIVITGFCGEAVSFGLYVTFSLIFIFMNYKSILRKA
ncbi:lipopolysaccharide biosynthesis protein [Aeromonas caviae]|uniref:lipopolysaccharide biosynthesis protein n=1 Tax=Aeromonas caviae TaxID=648 RepID=UPI0029DCE6D6|nr:hypothetical protein [Aeromonas caviae]MDX7872778.1 hypothetical protein [Aeromonas caviae]